MRPPSRGDKDRTLSCAGSPSGFSEAAFLEESVQSVAALSYSSLQCSSVWPTELWVKMAPHKKLLSTVEKRLPRLHNGPGAGTVKRDCSCILVALKELATFVVKHQSGHVIVRSERAQSDSQRCQQGCRWQHWYCSQKRWSSTWPSYWLGQGTGIETSVDPALDVAMLMIAQRANRFQQKLPHSLSVSAVSPMKSC